MYEIVWQYDETAPYEDTRPANAAEARRLLLDGNHSFAQFLAPQEHGNETIRYVLRVSPPDLGIGGRPGEAPTQEPFAAFLSCADARVPVELIFGQQANDLFVVRVAGNVLGEECLGSLSYAVDQLGTVRLLAVLGHTGCGALTAAVDAYLTPAGYLGVAANVPLQSIVGQLMAPVHGAAFALATAHGDGVAARPTYRRALIESSVIFNAALAAAVLIHTFDDALNEQLQVSFGVYDLRHRTVGLPALSDPDVEWQVGLFDPPTTQEGFEAFSTAVANSRFIRNILAL